MVYDDWYIKGIKPSFIKDVTYDKDKREFTLNCIAFKDILGADPRTEIEQFEAFACTSITNTQLKNGGSCLQIAGGNKVIVSNGIGRWIGAITYPKFKEDNMADKLIEYTLTVSIEESKGNMNIYTPSYAEYDNIDYHTFSDLSPNLENDISGTEIGNMKIFEEEDIRRVTIYGSACCCPAWIELNRDGRVYWNVSHDQGYAGNTKPYGWETIRWELRNPIKTLELRTSPHILPNDTCYLNSGCWLRYVRLDYV